MPHKTLKSIETEVGAAFLAESLTPETYADNQQQLDDLAKRLSNLKTQQQEKAHADHCQP